MNPNNMSVEKLSKKINRRYWAYSSGYIVCAVGMAVAVGVYSKPLGVACLLAELTYFFYVNMVNVGEMRIRLRTAQQYTKQIENQMKEVTESDQSSLPTRVDGQGQYL